MLDETTQNLTILQSPDLTDSTPATMPSEASEAPKDVVTPPLVKDDNSAQSEIKSQIVEPAQTAQIETKPGNGVSPHLPSMYRINEYILVFLQRNIMRLVQK